MNPFLSVLGASTVTTTTVAAHTSSTGGSIFDPIAKPIAWLLAEIYSVVPNYGVAIMILSVIWMLIIAPLTLKSTRSMLAMQKLQPKLKKLQEQHKNDRQAFAQAQMELFKEHQVSPFGSCLPMLLPLPVFIALFRVIDGLSHKVTGTSAQKQCGAAICYTPKYLAHGSRMYHDIVAAHGKLVAFGMDLSKSALASHGSFAAALPFFLVLVIMAFTGYLQSAQMMSRNTAAAANPQMKMMKYIPIVFSLICARFPAGVIIYYSMSNICRIVQQDAMYRFDPKVKALVAQEVAEVETMTHDIDEDKTRGRSTAKGYTPPKSASGGAGTKPAAPKKSGFRDILEQARQQAAQNQQSKSSGGNTNGKQNGGTNGKQNGGTNGKTKPATNGSSSGAPPARSRPNPGNRTNKKRRK